MGYPIQIDTLRMELSIIYVEGLQADNSKLLINAWRLVLPDLNGENPDKMFLKIVLT